MSWVALADAGDERRFGGKAVRLGAALRAGLPVPAGVALSASFVSDVAEADELALTELTRALAGLPGPVAVRSSVVGEDSSAASFAGQHRTCLNLRTPAEVAVAVAAVWRSAAAPSALAYRERLGLDSAPVVGVLIQALVDADTAGVMFSCHPVSGAKERLIEASWGLGQAVVAGAVVPDRYRLALSGDVLEQTAGDKPTALHAHPEGGLAERAIAPEASTRLCLDDDALHELHELAARCEALFEGPQDIEWAFAGRALHLLQSRAVTRAGGRDG